MQIYEKKIKMKNFKRNSIYLNKKSYIEIF